MGRTAVDGLCIRAINYDPLPSQWNFHRSAARFKGFSGPVGSGKSQALCQEAIHLAYINQGRLGLIGAPTYPMLHDVTRRALLEILDANRIPYIFNKAEDELKLVDCKSRIVFRPLDIYERLRGTNLAWFGLDELTYVQENAWLRLEARLRDPKAVRLCGFAAWSPRGYDWVYRKFITDRLADCEVTIARPFENRYLHPGYYDHLQSSYDENFYRQEALGQYLNVNCGLVYYAFDKTQHVRELAIDPGLPLIWSMDFNVDPMASIVAQATPRGDLFVLDEIILRHATTEMACEEFVRRYPAHPREVLIYGDASGYSHRSTSHETDYDIVQERLNYLGIRAAQFRTERRNPDVHMRVRVVNSRLRNARGEIKLWVDPRCKELIKDFEQVSYKADTMEIDKKRDRYRTHASDALGYLVFKDFAHIPTGGPQPNPLF